MAEIRDWEQTLLDNWPKIDNIINRFVGKANLVGSIFPVSGPRSQKTVDEDISKALRTKDFRRISHYMHEAWWRAPDNPTIHQIPGWDLFCDLLSESRKDTP